MHNYCRGTLGENAENKTQNSGGIDRQSMRSSVFEQNDPQSRYDGNDTTQRPPIVLNEASLGIEYSSQLSDGIKSQPQPLLPRKSPSVLLSPMGDYHDIHYQDSASGVGPTASIPRSVM